MASHKEHADLINRFAELIKEHEELKQQYTSLQTNFNLLAGGKLQEVFRALERVQNDKE